MRHWRGDHRLAVFLVFILAIAALGGPANKDETRSGASIRRPYRVLFEKAHGITPSRLEAFAFQSRAAMDGEYALEPLPLLITVREYEFLKKGIQQRGEALRRFLVDLHSGKQTFRNKVIPGPVVDAILARGWDLKWSPLIRGFPMRFTLGSDIMLGPDGTFLIGEDNTTDVGSWGDSHVVRNTLLEHFPEYRSLPIKDDPVDFHRQLVARYRQLANPKEGRIVIFSPYQSPEENLELERRREIFNALDVDVVTPWGENRLVAEQDGVYVVKPGMPRQRVGFIAAEGFWEYCDVSHPLTEEIAKALYLADGYTLEQLESDRKNLPTGIVDAFLAGKVAVSHASGLGPLDDKQFFGYTDAIIEFYLHEKPILRSIPTKSFARVARDGKLVLDEALLNRVLADQKGHVIKRVFGYGGNAVWVGANISRETFLSPAEEIRKHPAEYVVQPYIAPSVAYGRYVDRRLLAYVTELGTVVGPTVVTRSNSMSSDGKMNLSGTGSGMPTFVVDIEDDELPCSAQVAK